MNNESTREPSAKSEAPPAAAPPESPPPVAAAPQAIGRREVLGRLAGFGVAALGVSAGALLLHDRRPPPRVGSHALAKVHDFRLADGPSGSELVFTRSNHQLADAAELCRKLLEGLGGMGRFVRRGEKVVIKPNVGWDRNERQAANTNPAVVGALVKLCLEAGAGRVTVVDFSCNDARRSFTRSGVGLAAQQAGARVILPGDADFLPVAVGGGVLDSWPVLRSVLEADRVINVPIVKHHSLTGLTCAMKNLYGVIGGRRNLLHQRIDQSILDLGRFIRPTLVVVDALRVLERNGPQGGSFGDVREVGQLAATTDPVAADAWAASFLGLEPANVGYLRLAHGVLGRHDLQQVRELV